MLQLDTNILLHYIRHSVLSQRIEATYGITTSIQTSLLSIISEGEIRSLAIRSAWGAPRIQFLNQFLQPLVILNIDRPELVEAYALLHAYSVQVGRLMGQNDIWIAATAFVTSATLLTTDHDFDHLSPYFLTLIWIDPRTQ